MFEQGNIIYFDPFYFKNGNSPKPKFFVVLRFIHGKSVLASLPTIKDFVPTAHEHLQGCVELPESNLNCYVFAQNQIVTECGKSFALRTHLYGHLIDAYEVDLLNELYQNEGTDYEIFGKLKHEIFTELINCFKNSKSVKRKYKAIL